MRAQLIELTPESCSSSRKRAWLNIAFTSAWQSSKVPSTASAWTFGGVDRRHLPALHLRDAAVRVEDEDVDLVEARKASTAALPVSPEVAPTMVARAPRALRTWSISRAEELHRHVLEGERRAVEELEHEEVVADLDERADGRVAEGARRPRRSCGRELGRRDLAVDERARARAFATSA